MDYGAALRHLRTELKRIERVIRRLEEWQAEAERRKSTRGRRTMSSAERNSVSRRMKAYWARRKSPQGTTVSPAANAAN